MVTPLDSERAAISSTQPLPRLLELVGPAGAGKTTLARVLRTCTPRIQVVAHPNPGSISDLPFFFGNGFLMLPALLRFLRPRGIRYVTRREVAWMLILNGWHRILLRHRNCTDRILILDQGPVFLISVLHTLGPDCLRSASAYRWWRKVYRRWSAALDLIVYLDTSDGVLIDRIRNRPKDHPVKKRLDATACAFLDQHRSSYSRVLRELTASRSGPKVLPFDTSRQSPGEIVNTLLIELGLGSNQRG